MTTSTIAVPTIERGPQRGVRAVLAGVLLAVLLVTSFAVGRVTADSDSIRPGSAPADRVDDVRGENLRCDIQVPC